MMEKEKNVLEDTQANEYLYEYDSPLGSMTAVSDGKYLCGLWFEGQKHFNGHNQRMLPVFEKTREWLDCYFSGGVPDFLPPLSLKGTEFRKEVWEELLKIPYGKTISYGEIAAVIAERRGIERMSSRAVGQAVGHNPISIIVPCHRVIGADGSLTGYGGGLEKKVFLLSLEKARERD